MKIRTKLMTGFGIVLALTLAVGYISMTCLQTIQRATNNADQSNTLATLAQKVTIDRRDFAASKDQKIADTLRGKLAEIYSIIDQAIPQLESQKDKDGMAAAKAAAQEYGKGFDAYAAAIQGLVDADKGMVDAGRACEKELDKLASLEGFQINLILQKCRRSEKNFQLRDDAKYVDEVNTAIGKMLDVCQSIANRKGSQEAAPVIAAIHAYESAFKKYCDSQTLQKQHLTEIKVRADEFIGLCDKLHNSSSEQVNSAQVSSVTLTTLFSGAAVLVGIFIAFLIARGICRPVSAIGAVADLIAQGDVDHDIQVNSQDEIGKLAASFARLIDYLKELAGAAQKISTNDLTVKISPKSERDALGNAFSLMLTNLTTMIRQLGTNADQLSAAATQIASSSEEMAAGAKNQTSQAAQVSTAVEEMTATILESSKNAGEAKSAAESAAATSGEGQKIVGDTINGMVKIADAAAQSGQIVNELAKASDRIGEIIGVIDDIADQTNLLALNAAIEAARAGEQGRGFAVVADEVRKLAERTGKATGEITEMIKGIQADSNRAVSSMDSAAKLVEIGKSLANNAGQSLDEITSVAQRVTDMINQIATATEQQSTAAEEISKNMEHISAVTKETASGADQSALAAEELSRQAEELKHMVSRFKIPV